MFCNATNAAVLVRNQIRATEVQYTKRSFAAAAKISGGDSRIADEVDLSDFSADVRLNAVDLSSSFLKSRFICKSI